MNLIQMSMAAGILIVGIVIFRSLLIHRLPKKVMIVLWEIVILRLLFPFSISLSLPGIGSLTDHVALDGQIYNLETKVYETNQEAMENVAQNSRGGVIAVTSEQNQTMLFAAVYLAGAVLMAAGSAFLYFRDSQLFREGLPMPEQERERLLAVSRLEEREKERLCRVKFQISDRTATPVTYGVLRPSVVFPKGIFFLNEKETGLCLRHELVHIINHDNLKKLAAHGALCLHWFNPLVWVMYLLFNRDMELLCDETVVKREGGNRKEYARALLSLAECRSMGFRTGLGFGQNAVKERIVAVMTFKKTTLIGMLAATAAVASALTVFVTSAAQSTSRNTASAAEYSVTAQKAEDIIGWAEVAEDENAVIYQVTIDSVQPGETSAAVEDVESTTAASAETEAARAGGEWEMWETDGMPSSLKTGIENLVEEFKDDGLSAEYSTDDYQLYYYGEPVYFFADNRSKTGEGFSGRVYAREAGEENGYTGVVAKRDDNGKITGLEQLSIEESKEYSRAWTGAW
ncbi:MAG: M56 family metallopeptidase [Lachnospiraceae bacterium]|nr:M56 family metallopeptidase [Lachnospiraceae bacterium]